MPGGIDFIADLDHRENPKVMLYDYKLKDIDIRDLPDVST